MARDMDDAWRRWTAEPPHGYLRAYRQHQSHGDEFCAPCRAANASKMRQYRRDNPEKIKAIEAGRLRPADFAQQRRNAETLRKYGLTPESFADILANQNHSCAICADPFTSRGPQVDHNHDTGAMERGILCFQCNVGLGNFYDSPDLLRVAIDHLERNGHREGAKEGTGGSRSDDARAAS